MLSHIGHKHFLVREGQGIETDTPRYDSEIKKSEGLGLYWMFL